MVTSASGQFVKPLIEKLILSSINILIENGDEAIRCLCAQALLNLTLQNGTEDLLVLGGSLGIIQTFVSMGERVDTVCYALAAMINLGAHLTGADAEQVVRLVMQTSKRLEVMKNYDNAFFIISALLNLTRINHYSGLLCDDAVMPLLLHLMDAHPEEIVVAKCSECFVNLSLNRKNRREIASSGVAGQLEKIFTMGSPTVRSYALLMVGNLLSSGFFHEKISRDTLINNILENMLDPREENQFVAVSYCISQLAAHEASAVVIVRCHVIRVVLGLLRESPTEASSFFWNLLVNLSHEKKFFNKFMEDIDSLIPALHYEATKGIFIDDAIQIAYNLCLHKNLCNFLTDNLLPVLVEVLKTAFVSHQGTIRATALTTLVNLATYCQPSRLLILGRDMIHIFEEAGIDDAHANLKYAALLNIISNEEACCGRLLDAGAHKLMVSLLGSFSSFNSQKPLLVKSNEISLNPSTSSLHATVSAAMQNKNIVEDELLAETGRALLAATFHNLSLKRAVLGPGVLLSVLSLQRNCKTLRVLHCVRTLANISMHPRSKLTLAKEKRLIPILTAAMRCGCEEADRVQHYSAFVACNILALAIDKKIMEELCKSGAIVDLVVVTRLRVNDILTKETLAKALFNLLTRADFRNDMVSNLDVFPAMLELAKLESLELLELSVRCIYNLSCQTSIFVDSLLDLKIASILVARATSSPSISGSKPTSTIKYLCGMSLANISFNKKLQNELLTEKVADAAFCIMQLNTNEATYCSAVTLFNLSSNPLCTTMADSVAIPLLISIIKKGPALCIQLAVATITNMSLKEAFFEQLTAVAVAPMIELISIPQIGIPIKLDVLKFIYNISTQYPPSRIPCVQAEAVPALWKLLKSQDQENILISIGRVCKELCSEAWNAKVHQKLVFDGISDVILKLSKKEIPILKLDLSCCIFSLTTGGDTMRVLNWEGVDILFWLTLHDCLGMYDAIRKNVGRAMRNFSSSADEARVMVKEERLLSVIKALAKSTNEDVLWQAAGVVYNLMSVDDCRDILIERGIILLIFELASSGYSSVRHVCSACLHMVPNSMPDMDDPQVLALVLCLLEADGDKFAELGERTTSPLPYSLEIIAEGSPFEHFATDFAPSWLTITCDVDTVFSTSLIELPLGSFVKLDVKPFVPKISVADGQQKMYGRDYAFSKIGENEKNKRAATRQHTLLDGASGNTGDGNVQEDAVVSIPPLSNQSPPQFQNHGGGDSGVNSIASGKVIEPEQASAIAFPKIYALKPQVPQDTLGAIRGKTYNQPGKKLKGSKCEDSITVNKSQNTYA